MLTFIVANLYTSNTIPFDVRNNNVMPLKSKMKILEEAQGMVKNADIETNLFSFSDELKKHLVSNSQLG